MWNAIRTRPKVPVPTVVDSCRSATVNLILLVLAAAMSAAADPPADAEAEVEAEVEAEAEAEVDPALALVLAPPLVAAAVAVVVEVDAAEDVDADDVVDLAEAAGVDPAEAPEGRKEGTDLSPDVVDVEDVPWPLLVERWDPKP